MKKLFLLSSLTVLSLALIAQNSETRSLDNFHGVSASSSVDVELYKGSTNKAEIVVKNVDLDKVKTEIKKGILEVGLKGKNNWNWGIKKRSIKVVVTYTDAVSYTHLTLPTTPYV